MNGRERISRIFGGQPVDRPPFVPILGLYGARLSAQDSQTYYTDPSAYVIGQSAVMDLVAPDVICSPFVFTAEGVAFGGQEAFLPRHAPNMKSFAVREKADIARLRAPDPHRHPRLRFVLDTVTRMRDQLGDRAMICSPCPGPVDLPALMMGIDAWLDILLFDESTRSTVFDLAVDFFVVWANALLAAGADFVGVPVAFGSPNLVTRLQAEEVMLPVLRRAFAQVKGPIVFHHAGGPIGPFLPVYADLPGVAGFLVDQHDNLADARRAIGPGKILLGQLDAPKLVATSPAEVFAQATRILRERADDPMFFLSTSGPDVPWQTAPANLLAIREALEQVGEQRTGSKPAETTLVACSIFRPYIKGMDWQATGPDRVLYVDSALHVVPDELESILDSIIDFERERNRRVLVAYGDCTGHLVERCQRPGVRRIPIANCCAILVGAKRYRELRKDEIFAFLPEWTERWRPILQQAIGGDASMMRDLFRSSHQGIAFLDAVQHPVASQRQQEIAGFFDLPCTREQVSGQELHDQLRESLAQLRGG
jgi:uroporphyrinogen decarboxylase